MRMLAIPTWSVRTSGLLFPAACSVSMTSFVSRPPVIRSWKYVVTSPAVASFVVFITISIRRGPPPPLASRRRTRRRSWISVTFTTDTLVMNATSFSIPIRSPRTNVTRLSAWTSLPTTSMLISTEVSTTAAGCGTAADGANDSVSSIYTTSTGLSATHEYAS